MRPDPRPSLEQHLPKSKTRYGNLLLEQTAPTTDSGREHRGLQDTMSTMVLIQSMKALLAIKAIGKRRTGP